MTNMTNTDDTTVLNTHGKRRASDKPKPAKTVFIPPPTSVQLYLSDDSLHQAHADRVPGQQQVCG